MVNVVEDSSPHYLRHLTQVGDVRDVVATEDIENQQGIKLLARGGRVNSRQFLHLVQHKLLKPIDQSCAIAPAIDKILLIERATVLLSAQPPVMNLLEDLALDDFLQLAFAKIPLPSTINNKLTVLAEQAPELLDHCLWVTMAAVFIGRSLDLPAHNLRDLAAAALLHDLGELHIDERILNRRERLDANLRRQVYAHPLIGGAIARAVADYEPAVARAIDEHHERVDGSGYPKGLKGEQMSQLGRILSFVEFALGILQSAGLAHLTNVLKTYPRQFDSTVTAVFWKNLKRVNVTVQYPFELQNMPAMLSALLASMAAWEQLAADSFPIAWRLVEREVAAVRRALVSSGINAELIEELLRSADVDRASQQEACSVLREGVRQLRACIETIRSRAENDATLRGPQEALAWMDATELALREALLR